MEDEEEFTVDDEQADITESPKGEEMVAGHVRRTGSLGAPTSGGEPPPDGHYSWPLKLRQCPRYFLLMTTRYEDLLQALCTVLAMLCGG